MPVQIVVDLSGDTRHQFDQDDAAAVVEAQKRFGELIGAWFIAARRTGNGTSELSAISILPPRRRCSSHGSLADDLPVLLRVITCGFGPGTRVLGTVF
jgi:hypothetical protein